MMDIFSIKEIRVYSGSEIDVKAEGGRCPLATRDITENLKNRQNCIDTAGYGPLNPKMANESFWKAKADRWKVTIPESKKQRCGNCAAFIKTPRIMGCIEDGLGNEEGDSAWDVIEAGDLGYCEAFDFKCAASRTCDAWIVGGPITEEKEEKTYPFLEIDEKELIASEYIDSLTDDEFDIMFPDDSEETIQEAKWLFDTAGGYLRRALTGRRKRRKEIEVSENDILEKSAKKPVLRDPDGGLTAAGRKFFARTEGANLKPGVKGPANTPEKMRRKGSFLVRFFTNPRGPMKDEKGNPTRLALSAAAWGEPVPQTRAAALKLAAKGRRLLDRYRKLKNVQKKKSLLEQKQLGQPVAGSSGTVGNRARQQPTSRPPVGGGGSSSSTDTNYDPNAVDRDADGTIQEGTDYARPTQRNRDTNVGSADTRERNAQRNAIDKLGINWNNFGKLMRSEIAKLKPGDKTNWNPGRLPNGGKIAGDGTYIPPDMVREDDTRIDNYYANRRTERNRGNRPNMTADGTVIPDKNRDRATPNSSSRNRNNDGGNSKPSGSMFGGEPRTPWSNEPQTPWSNKPRTPWGGVVEDSNDRENRKRPTSGNTGSASTPGRQEVIPGGGKPVGDVGRTLRGNRDMLGQNVRVTPGKPGSRTRDDGITSDGTVVPDKNRDRATPNSRPADVGGSADARERRAEGPPKKFTNDYGSADTRERGAIRDELTRQGFDGEQFGELMEAAESQLAPGQDTNWNPGRLPGGGKISATGDYIPSDMVREDDKRMSDYYRNRRENKPEGPRMTADGTVIPDKNRDRATPNRNTGPRMTPDGTVVPDKNRDRATPPRESSSASGSVDAQERRISGQSGGAKPRATTTSSGDVVPDKNRDRATPQNRRTTQMSSDGTVKPDKNRDRATKPKRQISIIARDETDDNAWPRW